MSANKYGSKSLKAEPSASLNSSLEEFEPTEGQPQSASENQNANLNNTINQNRIRLSQLVMLGGLGALGPLATDMYLPALPAVSSELAASMSQAQLTLSAYILGLALGQVLIGPLSDALGRRGPLLVGVMTFVLASMLCIFAPSILTLTVLRFGQGVAGAAGVALALAIASDLYQGVTLARYLALLTMINAVAPILAPVMGSQLLAFTSWRGIFVLLALFGLVLSGAVAFFLQETLPLAHRQKGGLTTSMRVFKELITTRRFVGYALIGGFTFAACIVYISISPFMLQNLYGLSPQLFGAVFAINAVGLAVMAQLSGRLVGHVTSQKLLSWGVGASAIGGMSLLVAVFSGAGLGAVLVALFVVVASFGLIAPNATALALSGSKAAGSASALLGVMQLTIGAIVAPLVGLFGTSSAVPMALAIASFSLAALLSFVLACHFGRNQPQSLSHSTGQVEESCAG